MNITKWFRGLRVKLLILAFIPLVALVTVAYEGFHGAHILGKDLEVAVTDELPTAMYRGDMDAAVHTMSLWLFMTYSLTTDIQARENALHHAEEEFDRYVKTEKEYETLDLNDTEKKLYDPIHKAWPTVERSFKHAIALFKGHNPQDNEKANKILHEEFMPAVHIVDAAFEKLDDYQNEAMAEEIADSKDAEQRVYHMVSMFSSVGFISALAFAIAMAASLAKTLSRVSNDLSESADQVAAASAQIASASEELSQANVEQAASVEETATSLEEITAMVGKASTSAATAASSSSDCHNKAEQGRNSVEQMVTSIDEISQSNEAIMTQVNQSNQQMAEIVKVIQDIGTKTQVINEIVFQTRLLSFNASVEAARAGEHGKGFAVVAEEVGSLAQMSGNAAKEITDMLDGSISKVEKIVQDTKQRVDVLVTQGKEKVDAGIQIARQCSEVFNQIVQSVSGVTELSNEISQAGKEQSQGITEINKAMAQLNTVTQMNTATSEESAAAAEELSAQASSLQNSVIILATVIEGKVNRPTPETTPTVKKIKSKAISISKTKSKPKPEAA